MLELSDLSPCQMGVAPNGPTLAFQILEAVPNFPMLVKELKLRICTSDRCNRAKNQHTLCFWAVLLSSSKIYFLAFRILHKDLKSSFVTQSLSAHLSKTTQQQKMTQNCYHRSKPANQKKVIATCLLQNYINLLWLSSWSTDATRGHREYVFLRFSTIIYSP